MEKQVLYPASFHPAPPIIRSPPTQGGITGLAIEKSFALFWIDYAACANCLRSAVEAIFDDWFVERSRKFKERIDRLRAKQEIIKSAAHVAESLDKLLVFLNHASHGGDIDRDETLDAFELFESCIQGLYGEEDHSDDPGRIAYLRGH